MIGERVRQLRTKKGLSLSEFARRTGLSKGMISLVEHGKAEPSVETIRACAAALEVPVFTLLLQDGDSRGTLVRSSERMIISVPDSKTVRELITPDVNRAMVLLLARIPPGESSSPTMTTHQGEECVFVLRGTLTVQLQDEAYVLGVGDSFYFEARQPHVFRNEHDEEVEFISAITPASIHR